MKYAYFTMYFLINLVVSHDTYFYIYYSINYNQIYFISIINYFKWFKKNNTKAQQNNNILQLCNTNTTVYY